MPFFMEKPVTIEARQYDGSLESRIALADWINSSGHTACVSYTLIIETLGGQYLATPGDFIIKGVAGELYPCKPEIFAATYTAVEDENTTAEVNNG